MKSLWNVQQVSPIPKFIDQYILKFQCNSLLVFKVTEMFVKDSAMKETQSIISLIAISIPLVKSYYCLLEATQET